MNADQNLILGLPRRPRGNHQNAVTAIGALLGLVLTENAGGAILGGLAGKALSDQPVPLETAVRNYFLQNNLPVIFFYRSPKSVDITFKAYNQFWTVKSIIPDSLDLASEDTEDWLFGNLVKIELPVKLKQIRKALKV